VPRPAASVLLRLSLRAIPPEAIRLQGKQQNVVGFVAVALPVGVTWLAPHEPFCAVMVTRKSAGWSTASQENGAA